MSRTTTRASIETATKLIRNQTSLGGVRSSMESRWRWEGDRIPRGLLRLSVGLEDVEATSGPTSQRRSNDRLSADRPDRGCSAPLTAAAG